MLILISKTLFIIIFFVRFNDFIHMTVRYLFWNCCSISFFFVLDSLTRSQGQRISSIGLSFEISIHCLSLFSVQRSCSRRHVARILSRTEPTWRGSKVPRTKNQIFGFGLLLLGLVQFIFYILIFTIKLCFNFPLRGYEPPLATSLCSRDVYALILELLFMTTANDVWCHIKELTLSSYWNRRLLTLIPHSCQSVSRFP